VAGCLGDGGGNGGTASGTMSIGVMQPLTGAINYYGQQSLWGFLSGLAYKLDTEPPDVDSASQVTLEGDNVTYEVNIEDTAFDPNQAQDVATDLVTNQDVDVLFGTANSGAARQVIDNVVTEEEIPTLIGPAASAGITSSGEYCNEWVFRANENTAMDARSGGRYVANETDTESVFIMAADYSFGRAVAQNYASVLEAEGVEVADIRYVPREYSEFGGVFDEAEQTNADAVIGGFTFLTLPAFLTTALQYDFRIFGGFATRITNAAIGGVVQNALGEDFTAQDIKDAKMGPFTTRYHWNQYDNEINDAFVDTYSSTYGSVPDLFSSGTFVAASSLVQAVESGGSLERADVRDGLTGMTVTDTPKGEDAYTFQEYNNQARSDMTIAYPVPTRDEWADLWGAPIQPGDPIATIDGEDATIPADSSEMNCDL
jgi:branched-chain amino acid transport system substrate-binding protein